MKNFTIALLITIVFLSAVVYGMRNRHEIYRILHLTGGTVVAQPHGDFGGWHQ